MKKNIQLIYDKYDKRDDTVHKNYKNKKFQMQIEYDKQDEETQTNAKFTNNLPRKLKNKIILYKRNYYKRIEETKK